MTEDENERERMKPRLPLPLPSNVIALQSTDRREKLRIVEALLFAAAEPLDEAQLARYFVEGEDVRALLEELQSSYAARGVTLARVAGKWAFRTADDLSFLLEKQAVEQRRLSRAALETLAIIAYHQPVTRAEIEEIRGVSTSKGTIDVLLETGRAAEALAEYEASLREAPGRFNSLAGAARAAARAGKRDRAATHYAALLAVAAPGASRPELGEARGFKPE